MVRRSTSARRGVPRRSSRRLCQARGLAETDIGISGRDTGTAGAGADEDELRRLVDDHAPACYRLGLAIVRDPALAEDVVQETMIKAWRSLHTFRGEGSLRSWILRIAHNVAVSMLRKVRDVATDPTELPERAQEIGPHRRASGRMALDAMQEALAELDPVSRSIVVLRELEGLSYDEIAEALEIPTTTVKTRLFRARRRLATVMEEWT